VLDNNSDILCQNEPQGKERGDDFPVYLESAAPCHLEAGTKGGTPSFSNPQKRVFWNIVSQGEVETG
jgi:hypothetical protein